MKKQIITGVIASGVGLYAGYKLATRAIMKALNSEELKSKMTEAIEKELMKDYENRIRPEIKELIFDTIEDAETVVDGIDELILKYGYLSVSDLYDLAGINGNYKDNLYGWTKKGNISIGKSNHGYVVKMEQPIKLK